MNRSPETLLQRLRRFGRDNRAVAAVEFAFVFPVMLTLYLGSIELSQLITVDRRVTTIAGTVGDLVARSNGSISTSDLNDYFKASEAIMLPITATSLKQIVTCVQVTSAGVATVKWSKGYNGGVAKATNASFTLPDQVKNLAKGSYVIVAEAGFSYKPLLGLFFTTAVPLNRQTYYMPRYGEYIALTS